jgi:transcriptional regulator with XRE-family HTH domain
MNLFEYRATRGLTLEQAASELGLRSKGYLSSIESGQAPMPLRLALQIERWSGGGVLAIDLLAGEDAQLLRAALDRAVAAARRPAKSPAGAPA